jgi:hypothetical protein
MQAGIKATLVALLFACGAALAAEQPDEVYAHLHAAAAAHDLDAMRPYAAQAERATLVVPDVPKTYRLTGKAVRKDGAAVELRAVGTADSVGLGYTQIFGVIGLVRENGEWKVERVSWSAERPGEYPENYVLVEGAAPPPRSGAEAQRPRFALPPSAPEPSHLVSPKRAPEKPAQEHSLGVEPAPCEVKPVMTDEELRACGVHTSP